MKLSDMKQRIEWARLIGSGFWETVASPHENMKMFYQWKSQQQFTFGEFANRNQIKFQIETLHEHGEISE